MRNKEILRLLNEQLNMELFASNLYLSMCSYFTRQDLEGFANFFRIQSQEEHMHAMKIFDYVHNIGEKINMKAVKQPPTEFKSIQNVFEITLAQEKEVSEAINELVMISLKENDYATHSFLQWFINEQVEEEATITHILAQIKMIEDNKSALFLLNKDLGTRKFTVTA